VDWIVAGRADLNRVLAIVVEAALSPSPETLHREMGSSVLSMLQDRSDPGALVKGHQIVPPTYRVAVIRI
jgi:hypothetical protein